MKNERVKALLREQVNKRKLDTINIWTYLILSSILLGTIVLAVGMIFWTTQIVFDQKISLMIAVGGTAFLLVALLALLIFLFIRPSLANQLFDDVDWNMIYKIAFQDSGITEVEFKQFIINGSRFGKFGRFKGFNFLNLRSVKAHDALDSSIMIFKKGDDTITYQIENPTERYYNVGKNRKVYYTLTEWLHCESKNFNVVQPIEFAFKKKLKGNVETESIEFNDRYAIKSENDMDWTKLFSPKVIDKFITNENIAKTFVSKIENGKLTSKNDLKFDGFTTNRALDYPIASFRLYRSYKIFIEGVANEVFEDFDKFMAAYSFTKPFIS